MQSKELVICGIKAVRSRFETDSKSIKRLFFNRATAPAIGDLCRWMAQEHLVYRCVETNELELISGSIHHGGIVVVVEPRELRAPTREEIDHWARNNETMLLLDRVANVHNLGAVIRSAAFFGVNRLILPNHPQAAVPTEATYRVAEGGLDHVQVYSVDHLPAFIHNLRPHYFVIGAATRGQSLEQTWNSTRPTALVLGNEEQGLDRDVAEACDVLVSIPGSGKVESLNVSAAAAVLLWEITKSHQISSFRQTNQQVHPPGRGPRPRHE